MIYSDFSVTSVSSAVLFLAERTGMEEMVIDNGRYAWHKPAHLEESKNRKHE